MELEIIFQDDSYVAINKPHGLLVHRSKLAKDADEFALQRLRDQLDLHVYPCHRLDRKTSGVLLFALNEKAHKEASELFKERKVEKSYLSIVRGFTPDAQVIDYSLKSEKGNLQEAITEYKTLERFEIPLASGSHKTSRYSLIELSPTTGRMHQIRRHMAHVFHPILGDRPHGCNKQNKLWKETYHMDTMMLHAATLEFKTQEKKYSLCASYSDEFYRVIRILKKEI